jgi:hypothetical protein
MPKTSSVIIPWSTLKSHRSALTSFVAEHLEEEESRPDMTDGSSAEDSDLDSEYDLNNLLR